MEEINKDKLEETVSESSSRNSDGKKQKMSQEAEIVFHQGALNTLGNERNELIKMAQNVESIMQAHIGRLKELGVNIQLKQQGQEKQQSSQQEQHQENIEDK